MKPYKNGFYLWLPGGISVPICTAAVRWFWLTYEIFLLPNAFYLSYAALNQGDYLQAERYALEELALLNKLQLKYHSTIVLSMLAGPVAAQGRAWRAVKLLGASEAIFESMWVSLQPADQVEIDGYIALARQQLEEADFQEAWAEGWKLSFDEALSYALYG